MVMNLQPSSFRSPSPPLNVLLVDDDDFIHDALDAVIDKHRFSLSSAKCVNDAIAIVDKRSPDIIITDGMMPGESGFSFIEKLKSNPTTARTPVILWTILEDMGGDVMDGSGKADIK